MPLTVQVFDPYIQMDDIVTHYDSAESQTADMMYTFNYWAGMTTEGGEFTPGTVVTLNTDHPTEPTTYYLTITVPAEYAAEQNYPLHQTDVFHVIRTDVNGPDSDVSEIGGAQCRDCGAVNAILPHLDTLDALTPANVNLDAGAAPGLPEGVKPVWRQAADGAHTLCDDCADAERTVAVA